MTVKQTLKDCEVFSALTDAELAEVASSVLEKQFEAGTTLFHEGDSAEELLILEEGKVALQMTLLSTPTLGSRRITVDVVTKNEVIGWSVIVEPYTYTLTAICLQKAKTLSLSGTKLRRLLKDNHEIGYKVLKGLIRVVASRLDDTRRVLISERLLSQGGDRLPKTS